jgi:hypothetical protein
MQDDANPPVLPRNPNSGRLIAAAARPGLERVSLKFKMEKLGPGRGR